MIILGVDPGTAAMGYGIVERTGGRVREVDHGVFTTSPDLPMPQRLLAIHGLVDELLELHQPKLVAVERLFFSRNAQTAFAVGQARGVVLLAAAQHGTPVTEADAERGQERDRGLRRRRQGPGPADGPAGSGYERAATAR